MPIPGHDAEWNRGAYLVQGLGHCGACHTPRGLMLQEKALSERGGAFLAGAELDGWSATDLRGNVRTGLGTWSAADIVQFLRTGHNQRGSAFGSMTDVLNNSTPYLSDADLHAIAVYLKSLPPTATEPAPAYDRRDHGDRAPAGSGTAPAPRSTRRIARPATAPTAGASRRAFRASPAIRWCSTTIRPRSSIWC